MAGHSWVPSSLGHGEAMCQYCRITNREAAVLNSYTCDKVSPAAARYVQNIGRGQRAAPNLPRVSLPFNDAQSSHVVDFAGTKTGRLQCSPVEDAIPAANEACDCCIDEPSLIEQLARQLETFADDAEALCRRYGKSKEATARIQTFRDASAALRDAMTEDNKRAFHNDVRAMLCEIWGDDARTITTAARIVNMFMGKPE